MDKETEDKGAVRHGLIMADGSVSVRNDGTVGLKKHTKPTAMRLKPQKLTAHMATTLRCADGTR